VYIVIIDDKEPTPVGVDHVSGMFWSRPPEGNDSGVVPYLCHPFYPFVSIAMTGDCESGGLSFIRIQYGVEFKIDEVRQGEVGMNECSKTKWDTFTEESFK
jgi:hypothetical protein